jgi:hypothetical protein
MVLNIYFPSEIPLYDFFYSCLQICFYQKQPGKTGLF